MPRPAHSERRHHLRKDQHAQNAYKKGGSYNWCRKHAESDAVASLLRPNFLDVPAFDLFRVGQFQNVASEIDRRQASRRRTTVVSPNVNEPNNSPAATTSSIGAGYLEKFDAPAMQYIRPTGPRPFP